MQPDESDDHIHGGDKDISANENINPYQISNLIKSPNRSPGFLGDRVGSPTTNICRLEKRIRTAKEVERRRRSMLIYGNVDMRKEIL